MAYFCRAPRAQREAHRSGRAYARWGVVIISGPVIDTGPGREGTLVDVLVVTAADGEDEAVRQVGGTWHRIEGPRDFPLDIWRADLPVDIGGVLRIAACRTLEMGVVAAGHAASVLSDFLRPRALAMCGVCAGRPGWTNLGDVIIADRLYRYDVGELLNAVPGTPARYNADVLTYPFGAQWKQLAQNVAIPANTAWLSERPITRMAQTEWLLRELHSGHNPSASPDRASRCSDWTDIAQVLLRDKLIRVGADGVPTLTPAGKKRASALIFEHPDGIPAPAPFKIHIGPLGTGSSLIRDVDIWERLTSDERLLRGFDMEASAIAATGHTKDIPWVVVKGVMDYASFLRLLNY